MAKYVKWTSEERALIVNTIASFMKANGKTMADFQSPGWFSYYMNQGQQFLPEERRRRIASPMMASWIESGLRVALGEGPEAQILTQEQVNRLVHANLAAVITALQSTHVVVEKSLHFQMATQSRTGKIKQPKTVRQPSVLIVGTQPNQAAALSSIFGRDLDLRFWHSDSIRVNNTLPNVEFCVGLVSFMDHSTDSKLRAAFRSHRYWRVAGGTSGLERALSDIRDRAGRPVTAD